MKVDARKEGMIDAWGFRHMGNGFWIRYIYEDRGYLEYWFAKNPDVIEFIKEGKKVEEYKIDWNLFIN